MPHRFFTLEQNISAENTLRHFRGSTAEVVMRRNIMSNFRSNECRLAGSVYISAA